MRCRVALEEKGVQWTSRYVDLFKFDQMRPEYLAINPRSMVPTLVHDGKPVRESSVINEYIDAAFAGPALAPPDPLGAARMREFVYLCDEGFSAIVKLTMVKYILPKLRNGWDDDELRKQAERRPTKFYQDVHGRAVRGEITEQELGAARATIEELLDHLERTLAPGPWIVGSQLTRSTYAGEYGFLIVEPAAGDPARYDREVLLAAHLWQGEWVSMQDIRKGPPPDNGLEVMYHAATLGDRMLGHGEPIRVKQGERVLFRLLNASASMGTSLALPGHRFTVIALDGNPVPMQAAVDVLWLDVAERADVIVEMNNPGVWVLGAVDDMDRQMGLGVVVEYENRNGEPQWVAPEGKLGLHDFGKSGPVAEPDETFHLRFEKIPGGRGGYNRWTINGKSWPDTNPLFSVQEGKRYRLVMDNHSGDQHPVHIHRHTFEVTKIGDKSTSGLMKDTLSMPRFSTAEVDFVADDPGPTFFHCHHQDHMDEGFAGLITYV